MIYRVACGFSLAALIVFINALGFSQQTAPKPDNVPIVRHFVAPEYPISAWLAQIDGSAVMELIIKQDGTVDSATFVSGLPIFHKSIETALKDWTFRVADSTKINVTTQFKLARDCPWTASPVTYKRDAHSRIETQVFADLPAKIEIRTCAPTIETSVNQSHNH